METNNQNQPITQPPIQPLPNKKWYQHKGVIAILILFIIGTIVTSIYAANQPAPDINPIVFQHKDQKPLATSTPQQNPTSTEVQTDILNWKTYTDYDYGYSFQYPNNWKDAGFNQYNNDIKDFFTAPPKIEVLDLNILNSSLTPKQFAQADIVKNNCPSGDNLIQSSNKDALYTLSCSATTEDYIYIVQTQPETYVKLSYHDNFEENWPQSQKLAVLNQIISTFKFNVSFDMSKWVTYTNYSFGFSLNHPIATAADYQPTVSQKINDYNASSTYLTFGGGYYITVQENPKHLNLHDWFEKNVDENGILLANQNFKLLTTENGITALETPGNTIFPENYQGDGGIQTDVWYFETPDGKYIISYNYDWQDDELGGYGIPNDDGYLLGKEILNNIKLIK